MNADHAETMVNEARRYEAEGDHKRAAEYWELAKGHGWKPEEPVVEAAPVENEEEAN